MKVIVENEKSKIEFPCLMIHPEAKCILYVVGKSGCNYHGVCLEPGSSSNIIGRFRENWNDEFIPFNGKVILENRNEK